MESVGTSYSGILAPFRNEDVLRCWARQFDGIVEPATAGKLLAAFPLRCVGKFTRRR